MRHKILAISALMMITACTSSGGTNNPFVRPFQYFSYVNGDDIRSSCVQGGESKYRLVYNALYEEQVRTYDITQGFEKSSGVQVTRVFSHGIGSQLDISRDGFDFKANFHTTEPIDHQTLVALDKALIASDFEKPAKKGQILHSDEFYWVAMVCRDGNFKYYAWTQDSTDIAGLPFLAVLAKGDTTGAQVEHFRIPVFQDRGSRQNTGKEMGGDSYFPLEIGDNGLKL